MMLLIGIVLVFFLALSLWHLIDLLQFLQLHEYLSGRFLAWTIGHISRVLRPVEVPAFLVVFAGLLLPAGMAWTMAMAGLVVWIVTGIISVMRWRRLQAKAIKPLVFTARVKRLIAGGVIVLLLEAALFSWFVLGASPFNLASWQIVTPVGVLVLILLLWLASQASVLNLVSANLLTWPVEEAMRQYYIRSALKIIRQVNPIVIGITGSYGKTSTKEILAHLLGSKYEVLKTPRTFNTILGVSKVIREELKPKHKYFIVEMGAYKPGEIARICRLVKPHIGILTAVGPQHLERFKTVENIARAKFELIQALPKDGIAIFNGDDPICQTLADQSPVRALRYGTQPASPLLDLVGSDLSFSQSGTEFTLASDGLPGEVARMRLLGRHNVSNALGASLAALQCGLSIKEISRALATLPQLEHRLQVIQAGSGIITIDNAYNSNPSGAKVSLEVLASFQGRRKVLVTPGFAELGSIEAEEHANLGRSAARVCDLIFLIGVPERVDQILKGIREAGFDPEKVYCFPRLNDARVKMREVLQPGDVVLFENDLPDIY